MAELVSVFGDNNSHGGGALQASNNPNKLFIGGLKVNIIDSMALVDDLMHTPGETDAASGSGKVFLVGIAVHRNGDSRYCGATTIVSGQSKVYAN